MPKKTRPDQGAAITSASLRNRTIKSNSPNSIIIPKSTRLEKSTRHESNSTPRTNNPFIQCLVNWSEMRRFVRNIVDTYKEELIESLKDVLKNELRKDLSDLLREEVKRYSEFVQSDDHEEIEIINADEDIRSSSFQNIGNHVGNSSNETSNNQSIPSTGYFVENSQKSNTNNQNPNIKKSSQKKSSRERTTPESRANPTDTTILIGPDDVKHIKIVVDIKGRGGYSKYLVEWKDGGKQWIQCHTDETRQLFKPMRLRFWQKYNDAIKRAELQGQRIERRSTESMRLSFKKKKKAKIIHQKMRQPARRASQPQFYHHSKSRSTDETDQEESSTELDLDEITFDAKNRLPETNQIEMNSGPQSHPSSVEQIIENEKSATSNSSDSGFSRKRYGSTIVKSPEAGPSRVAKSVDEVNLNRLGISEDDVTAKNIINAYLEFHNKCDNSRSSVRE